jgi:hypothetical protein
LCKNRLKLKVYKLEIFLIHFLLPTSYFAPPHSIPGTRIPSVESSAQCNDGGASHNTIRRWT